MNNHLLFIPFLALLGTSCGGAHITTTPVVNAPRASVLNAPKRNAIDPNTKVRAVELDKLNYTNPNSNGWFRSIDPLPYVIAPTDNNTLPTILCSAFKTATPNQNWTTSETISIGMEGSVQIRDDSFIGLTSSQAKDRLYNVIAYYKATNGTPANETFYNEGYNAGYDNGMEDGYYSESNKLIPNGMYTGLTIFPRRHYLEEYAQKVLGGQVTAGAGQFYLIDTNGNYTIEIKWSYIQGETITRFQDSGNTIIGQLDWHDVADGYWNTSWFYKYDKELHYFASPKTYATDAPIETSFYPEVYLGSTFTGEDANIYFAGGGNGYQMGFADGQTYTIHASDTYNNVFTIFTPAFRAVADFFNLNIGPFKVWYFFAIPLIVTLLILVLRLVKH